MIHKHVWTKENHVRELCKAWHPNRGTIVLVNFGNDGIGSEQRSLRPAVIVSNDKNNEHSTVISVSPITSSLGKNRLPVHVYLDQSDGLKQMSICAVEQTRSVDKNRCLINGNIIVIAQLSDKRLAEIDMALKIQFNLF